MDVGTFYSLGKGYSCEVRKTPIYVVPVRVSRKDTLLKFLLVITFNLTEIAFMPSGDQLTSLFIPPLSSIYARYSSFSCSRLYGT